MLDGTFIKNFALEGEKKGGGGSEEELKGEDM